MYRNNGINFKYPRSFSSNTKAGSYDLNTPRTYGGVAPSILNLFEGGSFTRASEGRYINESGLVVTVDVNERRLTPDNTILLEGEQLNATTIINLVPYSEKLAEWAPDTGASVVSDSEISPDGTQSASKIAFSSSSSARIRIDMPDASHDDVDFTVSAWVKYIAGASGDVRFAIRRPDATFSGAQSFTLTSEWQRISGAFWNGSSSGASDPQIVIQNSSDGLARDISVWGVQVEEGLSAAPIINPISYIKTDGIATERESDFLIYSFGDYPESFLTEGFIIEHYPYQSSADMKERNNGAGWTGIVCGVHDANCYIRFLASAGNIHIDVRDNSGQKIVSSPIEFAANQQLTITVKPNAGILILEGFSSGDGTYTGTSFSWPPDGSFSVGRRTTSTAIGSNGRYGQYILGV